MRRRSFLWLELNSKKQRNSPGTTNPCREFVWFFRIICIYTRKEIKEGTDLRRVRPQTLWRGQWVYPIRTLYIDDLRKRRQKRPRPSIPKVKMSHHPRLSVQLHHPTLLRVRYRPVPNSFEWHQEITLNPYFGNDCHLLMKQKILRVRRSLTHNSPPSSIL